MIYRVKCPHCGEVFDAENPQVCPKCGKAIAFNPAGVIHIYRMGSPIGVAVGYGLYINDIPFGHIANTQTVHVYLPYGSYKLHMTCGMTRRCQDLTVNLSQQFPQAFVKAHIKMGMIQNTIYVEPADPSSIPM